MKKNPSRLPLLLATALSSTLVHGQAWTWTGDVSPNWSDLANWTNLTTHTSPATLGEFTHSNRIIRIGMGNIDYTTQANGAPALPIIDIGTGNFMPSNQDIEGLHVRELQIGMLTNNLVVGGKPIRVTERINHMNNQDPNGAGGNPLRQANFSITFSNEFAFAAGAPAGLHLSALHHLGRVSEYGGRRFIAYSNQQAQGVHYHAPADISSGFSAQGGSNFYGIETAGATNMPAFTPDFFRSSTYTFHFPHTPGLAEYEYDLQPEKGGSAAGALTAATQPGVTVVFNAPLADPATGTYGITKNFAGILELTATNNTFTGTIALNSGVLIFKEAVMPGASGTLVTSNGGALDLNGVDFTGRVFSFNQNHHASRDGIIRNQNPERESTVGGNVGILATSDKFGGVGDILYTGDIINAGTGGAAPDNTQNNNLKVGPGKLTMTGMSLHKGQSFMLGGTLVLDYTNNIATKLSETNPLTLLGKLELLGNTHHSITQTVANLAFGLNNEIENRIRISPTGRGGKDATFRFAQIDYFASLLNTVDFAPGNNGFIRTSEAANLTVLQPNALPVRFTFNGESYARVSTNVVDGYYAIKPILDNEYASVISTTLTNNLVDIANDVTLSSLSHAGAIRFNEPKPVTLTLGSAGHLRLYGDHTTDNGARGAILVTPRVGANTVAINGPGILGQNLANAPLYIHQYNTLAPLVINAQIFGYATGNSRYLIKTGPGELVLTSPNSGFYTADTGRSLLVLEGILTFDAIGDKEALSPLGAGQRILLGDATLRYTGTGHTSHRQIVLRGFGVVEASGTGPLVFTNPALLLEPTSGKNALFTLSGTGEGVIEGTLNNITAANTASGSRLRKRGSGTWTLGENSHSSYIWGAEIFDGTLVLNGSFGRDITVHANGTLSGKGLVKRDLYLNDGGTLALNPDAVLTVGKNLYLAEGALLSLPRKLPGVFVPVLKVNGKVEGSFTPPSHAYWKYDEQAKTFLVKLRPTGTLLMVR